jgi:hypothetical protein
MNKKREFCTLVYFRKKNKRIKRKKWDTWKTEKN